MPTGQPSWQQPGGTTPWQQPGAPQVPAQAGPPAWEQRPGPPAGPPPGGLSYGQPPPQRSRRGLWWSIGAVVVVLIVGAGVLVFVLTRGVDAPTGVSATVQADGVAVTWTAVDGATGYEVFREGDAVGTTDTTTFVDTEAPGGTDLQYTVVATNDDGDRSETAAAASGVLTPVEAPAPTASVDGAQVELLWEAVTGAERYEVTRNGELQADDLTEGSYVDQAAPLGDQSYEVTAVDEDGAGSTATGAVDVFSPGPWADAYEIAVAFPELVGSGPEESGWNGSNCAADPVEGTKALIFCEYADGVYIEVSQYADTAQFDARVTDIKSSAGVTTGTWSYGDGAAEGDLYLSGADSGTSWRFITFYESDRALFSIYAEWEGHSQEELRDTWFADAPF